MQMMSESMLQSFMKKMENMSTVQPNGAVGKKKEQKPSPRQQNERLASSSIRKTTDNRISQPDSNSEEEASNQFNDGVRNEEETPKKNKNHNVIDLDDNGEEQKSQVVEASYLSQLIALQKEKMLRKESAPFTAIRKTVPPSATPDQSVPSTQKAPLAKPNVLMPKVAVMNNLLKLSTRLGRNQLLRQIKYQAGLLLMAPIRLLLYFSIEKMLFNIYLASGHDKMSEMGGDWSFMQGQIKLAMIQLLGYLITAERALISRILRGVCTRLGFAQNFSQKWLSDALASNRKAIENRSVNFASIEHPPKNCNISSHIFTGIPSISKKTQFNFSSLKLEDEQECNQRIQDPEVIHSEEDLFFFKKIFNSEKVMKTTELQRKKTPPNQNGKNNYQVRQFAIEIQKLKCPQNTYIYSFQDLKETQEEKKRSESQERRQTRQTVSKKRGRPSYNVQIMQTRPTTQQPEGKPGDELTEQRVNEKIQKWIFGNIGQISSKLLQLWGISLQQLKKLLGKTDQLKILPSKMSKTTNQVLAKPKENKNIEILKKIEKISSKLEKSGASKTKMAKQIYKFLETQQLSDLEKEDITNEWLELKKQNLSTFE